jgi:hypothetical protein
MKMPIPNMHGHDTYVKKIRDGYSAVLFDLFLHGFRSILVGMSSRRSCTHAVAATVTTLPPAACLACTEPKTKRGASSRVLLEIEGSEGQIKACRYCSIPRGIEGAFWLALGRGREKLSVSIKKKVQRRTAPGQKLQSSPDPLPTIWSIRTWPFFLLPKLTNDLKYS